MDYSSRFQERVEFIVRELSQQNVSVSEFVQPDTVILSDGESTVSVSIGDTESEAIVECAGRSRVVRTSADSGDRAVGMTVKAIAMEYASGNELPSVAFSL